MPLRKPRLSAESHLRFTPDRLLQTATEIFARRGFDGASLREIAESAGSLFN